MRSKLMVLSFFTALLSLGNASAFYDEKYLTVKSVEIVEFNASGEEKLLSSETVATAEAVGGIGDVIATTRELIALGKEIYQIVKAGEPVVNLRYSPISVLPKNSAGQPVEMLEMEGWSAPKSAKYGIRCKNFYGMTTIKFDFMLMYSYGGTYNGKGKYLTSVQIVPLIAEVSWGYSLDSTFKLDSIMNHGTKENPVAGAVISLNYKYGTVLKRSEENKTFFVNGKGHANSY